MIAGPTAPPPPLRVCPGLNGVDETALDRIVALARMAFGARIALISRVDDGRSRVVSSQGLEARLMDDGHDAFLEALPLARGDLLVIPDATSDVRFANNKLVTGPPFLRGYAGVRLTSPQGAFLGALCVMDDRARTDLTTHEARTLALLADLAVNALSVHHERRSQEDQDQLLALAETMSGVGHWRLDTANGQVTWSDEVYRIHGVERSSFDPMLDSALDFYHPDDRPVLEAHLDQALRTGEGYSCTLRIQRRDGAWRQVSCKAISVLGRSREVVALVGAFQDVTEHLALLAQVREERERFRLLAENATDVIATYRADGTFTYLSPAITRLLGRTPESLIGRPTFDIIDTRDHDRVRGEFAALMRSGATSSRIEYRALTAAGETRWLEAHPTPVRDAAGRLTGFQDVVRDVSARRVAQMAAVDAAEQADGARVLAEESEARYRLLADHATDIIGRYALDGTILYISPACREVVGFAPEELLGRRTVDFIHAEDRERVSAQFADYVRAGRGAGPIHTEHRVTRSDGRTIWLEGHPRLVHDSEGRAIEFHDVMRDVTARIELQSELEAACAAAEIAAQAKADFLANMSHELRTPLGSIIGFAELVAQAPELETETRRRATLVQTASRSLLNIVDDILDLSKLESEGVALTPEPTDLSALLTDTAELVRHEADRRGLSLTVSVEAGPWVDVDPARLRQVVLNLLTNALKFTRDGGVTLTLARGAERDVEIAVSDTGIGIAPDRLAAIFERFSQAEASTARRFGGTGLGLAISRSIVEAMGGRIEVHSDVGRGSSFSIHLDPPRSAEGAEAPTPSSEASPLLALRVLVVDDHSLNRELFCLLAAGTGLQVETAANGTEAVEAIRSAHYDLVFMDMQMPDMDGLEATRTIRGLGLRNVPIIALTANALGAEAERCREAGMNDHLPKPYGRADIIRAAQRWGPATQGALQENVGQDWSRVAI